MASKRNIFFLLSEYQVLIHPGSAIPPPPTPQVGRWGWGGGEKNTLVCIIVWSMLGAEGGGGEEVLDQNRE